MVNMDFNEHQSDQVSVFVQQLTTCQPQIYAFILTLVPNWSDADDLMQETAEVMWRKYPEAGQIDNFCAWAKRIARNKVMNFYTQKKRQRVLFNDALLDDIVARENRSSAHTALRLRALEQCLRKLRSKDLHLIQALYGHDITIKKLAKDIQRPVQGLYKAMARIHHSLLLCVRRTLPAMEDCS